MKSGSRRKLPPKLVAARREFTRWRQGRRPGDRIPEGLWEAAVELARELGLNPTARALRLDYYSLKKHVDAAGVSTPSSSSKASTPGAVGAFVELNAAAIVGQRECVVELEHPGGAKMRIRLEGSIDRELSALAGAFLKS